MSVSTLSPLRRSLTPKPLAYKVFPPWTTATGLVVRGYKSKIDDSVQPYGLVVPASYDLKTARLFRLDFWCHGRGEKLTELNFLDGRLKNLGEFTPPNAFVLHLYGRYCCANKFAGEIDLFEALAAVLAVLPHLRAGAVPHHEARLARVLRQKILDVTVIAGKVLIGVFRIFQNLAADDEPARFREHYRFFTALISPMIILGERTPARRSDEQQRRRQSIFAQVHRVLPG